jgi:putative ABC transport system substrate-binding protein
MLHAKRSSLRMNRRRAVLGLAALGGGAYFSARAQAPARVPRVVTVTYGSPYNARSRTDAFRKGMLELGYEDGRNVHLEWRSANGQPDLLHALALQIARERVDAIVSSSTIVTEVLAQATKTIPIVMASAEEPVAAGFVRSLARPESNVTGLTSNSLEQIPRHLELLATTVARLTRVAALLNPSNSMYTPYRARLATLAKASRMQLVVVDAATSHEIERGFSRLEAKNVGGLVVMSDGFFYNERVTITELATRFHLPAIYAHQGYSAAGGLMSYGPNLEDNYFRAAAFVDKILKGANPAELPIESPANHELIVNRRAARAIGLSLPVELVKRANKVIG